MSRARSLLASFLINPSTGAVTRRWHNTKRQLSRSRHTVVFYYRVADAWSGLLCQILSRLVEEYEIDIQIKLVSSLAVDCVSDSQRQDQYAAYDAMRLARAWGLNFPDDPELPDPALVHLAERIILAQPDNNLISLAAVSATVWAGNKVALSEMADSCGAVDESQASARLSANSRQLRRRGHYQGGMLWFQGEWFWGLDRLSLLEARLRGYSLNRREQSLSSRMFKPLPREQGGSASPLDLEFYFSFRSPYSYLAALKIVPLADRLGLNLILRPVLPLVVRGIPVPARKLRYIIKDVARVARDENIPFGPIRDPIGKSVKRCLAILHLASEQGVGREFMQVALQAIWTEAADLARDETMYRVAATVGLSRQNVDMALASGKWRAQVEANAAALAVLGLWGVPSMCLRGPDDKAITIAWGQDRLWVIERAVLGIDLTIPAPRLVQ